MARVVMYSFIITSMILWYFILFAGGGGHIAPFNGVVGVAAANSHGSLLEGRDYHHEPRGHIRRSLNHCWRRYDGYNLQNTVYNKKEQLKKPYGILCTFKCTWFFTITYPSCEYIYDYKMSCYLFTSLPDCTSVKCTLINYFS